jgi:midasin (ATPase involved in ribosome maturation)
MQAEPLAEQVMHRIDQVAMQYHRLILVVAPSGAGKTRVLQEVAKRTGCRCINVNLELSRGLLDFTERQ